MLSAKCLSAKRPWSPGPASYTIRKTANVWISGSRRRLQDDGECSAMNLEAGRLVICGGQAASVNFGLGLLPREPHQVGSDERRRSVGLAAIVQVAYTSLFPMKATLA